MGKNGIKHLMRFSVCALIGFLTSSVLFAEPSEKVLRYHQLLLKKPQAGTVLDRFVDAWLEEGSPADLTGFLKQRSERSNANEADHLLLALYLAHEGTDDALALASFQKAVTMNPAQPQAWLERGRLELRMLDFQASLVSLDKVLALHPEPKAALEAAKLRGRILLRLGRTADALEAWAALTKDRPEDEELADELVDLQVDEGLYEEAVARLKALISKPGDPYIRANRLLRSGDILLRLARQSEALNAYAEALGLSAADSWLEAESLARMESTFRREDNLKGLAGYLQELGRSHAGRLALQKAAASVLAEWGEKDKAVVLYQDLLQRSPGSRDMRESFLDLLERLEKYPEAIAQTRTLIEQNPRDRELQMRLAALQQEAGDKSGSAAALAAFLAAGGTDEFDHLRVANLLDQWGRKDEARAAFDKVVTAYPKSFEVRDAYAQFLHRHDDKAEALKVWRELAQGAGRDELLAVSMGLLARQEPQTAYDLLKARVADFGHEPQFLAPLCQAALAVKQAPAAVPWARARVQLTDESTGLSDALVQALAVLREADAVESTLKELRSKVQTSTSERCLLSALLEAQGELTESEKVLHGAGSPDAALALQTQLIRLHMSRQEYARAASATESLMAMPGGRTAQNAQKRVDLLNRSGSVEAAVKAIELWKQLAPATAQPYLTESQLLRSLGQAEKALVVLRAGARKFEGDDGLASALADTYAETGQYTQTERIYLGLYERAQDQTAKLRWIKSLADAALLRGEVSGLVSRFRDRQASNRADAVPWLALAVIHSAAEKPVEQLAALHEAFRLRPSDTSTATQIARLLEESGDWKEAMKILERVSMQDRTGRLRTSIALLELRHGSADKAFQMLADVAGGDKIDPRDAETIADAMAATGEWKRVVDFLTPLIIKHPGDYRLGYQRAVALEEDGQSAAARGAFMLLLGIHNELPGFPRQKQLTNSSWEKAYASYAPAALKMMRVQNANWEAYRYQQQHNSMTASVKGGFLALPDGVVESEAYAGAHLMRLAQELSTVEREALLQPLKDRGFEAAPLVAFFESTGPYNSWVLPGNVLKRFPKDVLLHSVWYPYGQQGEEVAVMARQAFDLLKDSYPQVAIGKALFGVAADPEHSESLLADAAALAARTPGNAMGGSDYLWQCSSLLGSGQNITQATPSHLPEEMQKVVQSLMLECFSGESVESENHAVSLVQLMHALCHRKAWKELVNLLDAEIVRYRASPAATKLATKAFPLPQRNQGPPQPLVFPPAGTMPQHVVSCLAYPDPYNPSNYGVMQPLQDASGLLSVMNEVVDPQLRVVLLWLAGDSKRAKAEADALMTKPDASGTVFLLGAALAQRMEEPERALALVSRASSLSMVADQRKAVDEALLTLIMEIPKVPEDVLEPARLAVRRLRSQSGSQMESVADMMDKLAMQDEAKRLRALVASSPKSRTSGGYASYGGNRASRSRVDQLMQKGNTEGAVQEWLKGGLGQYMNNYFQGNMSYALSQISDEISNREQLVKPALKWLESKAGLSLQKRIECVVWLDLFGQKDKAREGFANLVLQQPKNGLFRARLIALTLEKNVVQGTHMLEETDPSLLPDVMQTGLFELMRELMKPDQRLAVLGSFARLAEKWSGEGRPLSGELADLYRSLPALARYRFYNVPGASVPDMDIKPDALNKPTELAIVKQRREVHDALCTAMLKHPGVASDAFASLTLTSDRTILMPLARRLIGKPVQRVTVSSYQRMQVQSGEGEKRMWLPHPAQYLIAEAARRGDLAAVEADLLPLAKSGLSSSEFAAVEAYTRLWLCTAQEFPAAVSEYFKRNLNPYDYNESQSADACIPVDIMEERKLAVDLAGVVCNVVKQGQSWQPPALAVRYVHHLNRAGTRRPLEAFVDRLAEGLMGSMSSRDAKIKAFTRAYWGSGGANDRSGYLLKSFVEKFMSDPATLSLSFMMADRIGFARDPDWQRNMTGRIDLGKLANDSSLVVMLLRDSPFLKDSGDFDAWSRDGGRSSILANCFTSIDRGRESVTVLQAVRDSLSKMQPRTFGLDLCTALAVESKDRAGSLASFVKQRSSDIAHVPASKQLGLVSVLKTFMPGLKTPATLDPVLFKALEPLIGAEITAQKNRVDAILAARTYSELGRSDSRFFEEVYPLMGDLLRTDRAKAKALFLKASDLIETKAAKQGFDTASTKGGWTLRSSLLGWFIQSNKTLEATGFAHQMFGEDKSGMLIQSVGNSNAGNWGTSLMDAFKAAGGMGNVGRGLKQTLVRLQSLMDSAPPASLACAFYDFSGKLPSSMRIPAVKWCVKKEHPFAADLDAALRLHLTTDPGTRKNSSILKALQETGGTAPMWEHYQGVVLGENLSPQVRIAVAADVLKREWHGAPQELVRKAADLVAQEHAALHACSGAGHVRWIARAFCELPLDDVWKEAACRQWEAWLLRNARNSEDARYNRAYNPDDESSSGTLAIVARLGNTEWCEKLLRDTERSQTNEPSAFGILVKGGQHTLAIKWLERWGMNFLYNYNEELLWSPEIAAEAPKFAAACGNPDMAMLGEILLNQLKDEPAPMPGMKSKKDRNLALVPKFLATKFARPEVRQRCLQYLCMTDEVMDVAELRPELDAALKSVDPTAYMAMADTWKTFRAANAPAGALALQVLNDGNTGPALDLLPRMLAMPGESRYGEEDHVKNWTIGYQFGPILYFAETRMGTRKPFNEAALTKVCAELAIRLPTSKNATAADTVAAHATSLLMLHHVRNGGLKGFEAWRKTLSDEDASRCKEQFIRGKNAQWVMCQTAFGKPKPHVGLEERIHIVDQFLTVDWVKGLYPEAGQNLPNLCNLLVNQHKLFTPDEFSTAAPVFAKTLPRNGRTAGEAADLLVQQGKVAEALPVFDLAVSQVAKDVNLQASFLFRKAEALERLNRKADAIAALNGMDKSKLGAGNKKQLETNLKRLGSG